MRATRVGDVRERFFQRIAVDDVTGCWNWTGSLAKFGYGYIAGEIDGKRYAPKGQRILAHRVSWILHHGEIPAGDGAHGTVVMHKCDNPRCVNPAHLMLGTQADNVLDMIAKGRKPPRKVKSGIEHHRSVITNQADVDLICATKGKTKELAARFGVNISVIKRLRQQNGVGSQEPAKFVPKPISKEVIDHIRSTPPGTRGLVKQYGLSKTAIAKIRMGLTYKAKND